MKYKINISNPHLPIQKVTTHNNLLVVSNLRMVIFLLRDKLGTKIEVKNAKKSKYIYGNLSSYFILFN